MFGDAEKRTIEIVKAACQNASAWKLGLFLLSIFCVVNVSNAQTAFQYVKHFTVADGLLNDVITAIEQDESGNLWVGSKRGLQQFDGHNLHAVTSSKNDLSKIPVKDLLVDDDGTLWVIADQKIFYKKSFQDFQLFSHQSLNELRSHPVKLMKDWKGNLFVIFSDGLIYQFSSTEIELRRVTNLAASVPYPVRCMVQEKKSGKYWFANERKIFFYDSLEEQYTELNFGNLPGLSSSEDAVMKVNSIYIDRTNTLWLSVKTIRSSYTLKRNLDDVSWEIVQNEKSFSPTSFYSSLRGTVWGISNTLAFRQNNTWKPLNFFSGDAFALNNVIDTIFDVSEGRDGSLWIASDNGLFAFLPQLENFLYADSESSTSGSISLNNLLNVNDSLLFVFGSDGVKVMDANLHDVSKKYTWVEPFTRRAIVSQGSDGLWLAKSDRLTHINLQKKASVNYFISESLKANISVIMPSEQGNGVWFGTDKGVVGYWKRATEQSDVIADLNTMEGFIEAPIEEILQRPDDPRVYIRTNRQVVNILDGESEIVPLRRGIIVNDAKIYDDGLLIATNRGLYFYDAGTREVDSVSSLLNFDILTIVRDRYHYIWATTAGNGLYKLSPSMDELIHYGEAEGVVYSDFSPAATTRFGQYIITATTKGLLAFDPARTQNVLFNPRLRIVSFRVNDIDYTQNLDTSPLVLRWNENSINVGFSSMSFLTSHKLEFTYRLEGQSDNWETTREGERIRYSKLPPGHYTFRVRCRSAFSRAISDEVSVNFEIAKPFWETISFQAAVIVFLSLIAFVAYQRRERRNKRIQEIKSKISRDLHDHIGSSLSSINIMLQVAQFSIKERPDHSVDLMKKISSTAHLAQENLHDIVWSINTGNDSLGHILDRMKEFMFSLFEGQNVNTNFTVADGFEDLKIDLEKRYDLYLLFKELVNNGAKYSLAKNVSVSIHYTNDDIVLQYSDDGVGFDIHAPESGNGIRNMKERANALDGEINFESTINGGTQVTLVFPR